MYLYAVCEGVWNSYDGDEVIKTANYESHRKPYY